jgi:hypothetical protein
MVYMKALGLLVMILMALGGTASATVLKSGGGTLGVGDELELSLSSGTSSYFQSSGGTTINTCTSITIGGKVGNAGGTSATVSEKVEVLTFSNCVSPIHTVALGSLEFHHITGTTNGTVTASGAVLSHTLFGTNCLYEWGAGKDFGDLAGGKPATLNINITLNEAEPKKAFCPDSTRWSAQLTATKPAELITEAS